MSLNFITKEDYDKLKLLDREYYFDARWKYIEEVINIIKDTNIQFNNCIELGAYLFSIAKEQDTIDILSKSNPTYLMDANITPWSIKKKYDLFIGLQVLEHLKNKTEICNEIKKISNYAVISLPYKWNCKDINNCHHMIDEEVIYSWFKIEPKYTKIQEYRIINFYEFKSS
jgi:hypothetical protein